MINVDKKVVYSFSECVSKYGYSYSELDDIWKLSKDISINVCSAKKMLDEDIRNSYVKVLSYFASNMSAAHTRNIACCLLYYLVNAKVSCIDVSKIINYRSSLTRQNEWYLVPVRILLKKWYELGYPGVSEDVVQLLESWSLKGNLTGDAVKRLDPEVGPLSDIELLAFNEGAAQAYERKKITLYELAF